MTLRHISAQTPLPFLLTRDGSFVFAGLIGMNIVASRTASPLTNGTSYLDIDIHPRYISIRTHTVSVRSHSDMPWMIIN